jgi:hypothetical protein
MLHDFLGNPRMTLRECVTVLGAAGMSIRLPAGGTAD